MLEDYYVKPSTIDRVRSSWLAPQIESYLEWLQAHGYSRLVVYRCSFLFCGRAFPCSLGVGVQGKGAVSLK